MGLRLNDKRDDISAYAPWIGECPVCHPASVSSGLGWPPAGARWVSKLSKLLNQENALSAPCLRGDSCSPQAPPAGRGNAADRRDPSLLMSHYSLLHPSHHADKR
jgi:hypothetical protein